MPVAHRPPRLQPVEHKNHPKMRSLPTPLRIDAAPTHPPAVTLVLEETPTSALSDQSEAESILPPKPKSLRNQKKLSLALPSAHSNASSSSLSFPDSPASIAPPVIQPAPPPAARRRPSVVSLPNASASTLLHRRDEEAASPSAPYIDGPIQILPGIWIGSEDNARDWKGLIEKGIKSILNVAKEVASPYASAADAPLRPTASTPNLALAFSESKIDPTYVPPHGPSGRPPMHYLRLPWSHGQADLVRGGFVAGMAFVDESLERGDGVLIHCQCGVSRSATMVIALVMRAAHSDSPSMPPEVLALKNGGMHASYAFVKEKSKWVGPNMSLMYQLLEYERSLGGGNRSPTPSDRSSQLAEEAEWGRRRQELEEASPDDEERESLELMREARALDLEMEQRMVARKGSQQSTTASTGTSGSGIGMGNAWKSRFGHGGRSRAGSVASNFTNRSVLSEDLLEEDEDNMDNMLDIPAESSSGTPSTETTEEEARVASRPRHNVFTPTTARPPPTAPATRQSFGFLPPPSARHSKTTFGSLPPPPSAPAAKQSFSLSAPPSKFKKRRPPPLLPPVPPSPVGAKSPEVEQKPKSKPKPLRQVPPPLRIPSTSASSVPSASSRRSSSSTTAPAPTPSQTLFVFPPEQSVSTPSTMTLTSNMSSVPFPTLSTPRVSTFKKEGRRRSLIALGAPPTPTTACSRVDARGWVAMGP